MNESQVSVPLSVRLRFGHAAVQHVAESIAASTCCTSRASRWIPSLRPCPPAATSTYSCAPSTSPGWTGRCGTRVAPVQHLRLRLAVRPRADVPARRVGIPRHPPLFPGIRVSRTWRSSDVGGSAPSQIADVGCLVPSVPAQAVLLILNAARSVPTGADVAMAGRFPRNDSAAGRGRRGRARRACRVRGRCRRARTLSRGARLPALEGRVRGREPSRRSGGRVCARHRRPRRAARDAPVHRW